MKLSSMLLASITALTLFLSSSANATLITTSGDAVSGNVSLSVDVTFEALSAGTITALAFGGSSLDDTRDAVRFDGANQLTITHNGATYDTPFMDLNDGFDNGYPYLWFMGPAVDIGDIITISGTASNGSFEFGNSASTFSLLASGDYDLSLDGIDSRVLVNDVPEPSSIALLTLGLLGLRRLKR